MTDARLRQIAAARIRRGGHEWTDLIAEGDRIELRWRPQDPCVYVVIEELDLLEFVRGARAFAGNLDPGTARAWYRAFTITIFLVGTPRKLRAYHLEHSAADGRIGWLGPTKKLVNDGMIRLLKPLQTRPGADLVPFVCAGSGAASKRVLIVTIPAASRPLEAILSDLHHVIVEGVIEGLVRPEDDLRVRFCDTVDVRESALSVRVAIADGCLRIGGVIEAETIMDHRTNGAHA